jgi:hypothetical protein
MESIHRQNSFKRRNNTMKIHKWKNNELNRLLMEKFGFGEGAPADDEWSKKQEIVAEEEEVEETETDETVTEGEYNRKMSSEEKAKSDSNRPMRALKKTLKDDGMSDEEIAKLSDDEIDKKAADIRLSKPQRDRNAKRMKAAKEKEETNESFRRNIRSMIEEILDSETEAALNDPAIEATSPPPSADSIEAELSAMMEEWISKNPDATPHETMMEYYRLSGEMRGF